MFVVRQLRSLRASRPLGFFNQFSRNAKLLLLATVVGGITFSGFQLFFNFFVLARGFDRDFLGLLNALPSGAALLVGIPMGLLSDRVGRRRAMLAGITLSTLALWVQISTRSASVMVLMAALVGISNSLYFLSLAPFMMRASSERERTMLFSLNFGLMTLSGSVGNLVAGQLPGWFAGWLGVEAGSAQAYGAVLIASVLAGAVALIPIYLIKEMRWPVLKQHARPALADVKALAEPLVLKLSAPNFIIGFGAAVLIPYMNVFFRGKFGISDAALGVLFSASAVITGAATVIGPKLAERYQSKVKAVVLTQGVSVLFLLTLGFAPWMSLAGLAFLVRGALMNMANPLYQAFAMEQIDERRRGAVNSVFALMWEVGWTVGPYLSAVVQSRYGFGPLFLTTAILYSLAIWLTWVFHGRTETRQLAGEVATG